MKPITLQIAGTTLPMPAPFTPNIHGQKPIQKTKSFGNSSTHTRMTNKQMVKRKRKLKRTQRQRIQAR